MRSLVANGTVLLCLALLAPSALASASGPGWARIEYLTPYVAKDAVCTPRYCGEGSWVCLGVCGSGYGVWGSLRVTIQDDLSAGEFRWSLESEEGAKCEQGVSSSSIALVVDPGCPLLWIFLERGARGVVEATWS